MSSMKVASYNNVKVYNLTSNKTAPQWLSESQKRKLAKDEDYRKRLELIQDFEMKTASQSIKMTPDKEHIIVTGTYPPIIKCYTVSDLSLKFQRGLTCEVQAFETLSEDFGKLVFLQTDRTLSFHAPYGQHYNIRIPKFGRSLTYGWDSCDLYVSSCGEEVYRLSLETGQFKEPLTLGYSGCNKVALNASVPQLLACGGESSMCEFWDLRTRKSVAKINVTDDKHIEISELKFDTDGLTLGVGTSNGYCILYDIRSSKPIYTKEHQYELPIVNITFHNSSRHIVSTDKKIVKIWERDSPNQGKILTNIEAPANINDIHIVEDKRGESGLIMIAGEQSRVMTFFVPRLGPAPRWCSFLENLTEELEETSGQTVYEDFKFVTKSEVEEIGASGLIGTPMLRAYMHGFFMEMKLYNKLRAVSKPFEYEEYRRKKIKEKIEEKRQSRITVQKRLPKVNQALAEKLLKQNKSNNENDSNVDPSKLIDSRFAALFKRDDFEVDPNSDEFKLKHGTQKATAKAKMSRDESDDDLEDIYEEVDDNNNNDNNDDDDFENDYEDDVDESSNEDDDESDLEEIRHQPYKKGKKRAKYNNNNDDDDDDGEIIRTTKRIIEKNKNKMNNNNNNGNKNKGPRMYEIADGVSSNKGIFNYTNEEKLTRKKEKELSQIPLKDRISSLPNNNTNSEIKIGRKDGLGIIREMSYMPKESKKIYKGDNLINEPKNYNKKTKR